jgi:oligosaccharide repeat unit polymerase
MMIIVMIFFVLLLVLGVYLSKKNIFSPSVITPGIWLLCLSLFLLLSHTLPPLTSQFLIAISLWVFLLSFTSLLMQSTRSVTKERKVSTFVRSSYFWISVLTYPLLLMFAYKAITTGTSGSWSLDLRLAAVGESIHFDKEYGGLYTIIWQVAYLIELMYYSKKTRHRVFILGFILISMGFLTMAKGMFLMFFVQTICVLYFKKVVSLKHLLYGLGGLFFLFVWLQSLRHSIDLSTAEEKEDFLVLYLLSSMSAFDTLEPASALHFGENVLKVFYSMFYKLGWSSVEPVEAILKFIKEPIMTNTYTTMYPYFVDFGYVGVGIFAVVMGGFYGYLFKRAQQGDEFYIVLYSFFVAFVVMQYVNEMMFTYLSGNIKNILLVYFPFFVAKYNFLRTKRSPKTLQTNA